MAEVLKTIGAPEAAKENPLAEAWGHAIRAAKSFGVRALTVAAIAAPAVGGCSPQAHDQAKTFDAGSTDASGIDAYSFSGNDLYVADDVVEASASGGADETEVIEPSIEGPAVMGDSDGITVFGQADELVEITIELERDDEETDTTEELGQTTFDVDGHFAIDVKFGGKDFKEAKEGDFVLVKVNGKLDAEYELDGAGENVEPM